MTTARPLIGLSGRRKRGADIAGLPASLAAVEIDLYVSDYARAITAAGGLPVHLPQHVDPAEYAGRLDGLLLSGGADVDPERVRRRTAARPHPPEPDRDAAELGLVELAVADDLPVLGICRGLQLLNVWAGGTLHQHVPEHARYDLPPERRFDEVDRRAGSRAPRDVRRTSSASTRCTTRPSTASRAAGSSTARSGDGTVEALEWPGHDVIAVQWHPELLPGAGSDPLFAWLVERAARRRAGRRG